MDVDFPREFDLVVVGTGFSESVVAAAASRIGKTVLHVDSNDFYGRNWASFNLENFQSFLDSKSLSESNSIYFAKQIWHTPTETTGAPYSKEDWTKADIIKKSRKFNIDLAPKLLFSAGSLVDLLITSNICRYAEFRAIDKIFTLFEGELLGVPCSRNDIFNSKDLSIVEKRLLMRLLSSCLNYEEGSEDFKQYKDKTFFEFLKAKKLTDKVLHCVLYSIAMCDEKTGLHEGINYIKIFLNSLGRYGNSPFLFPMHGCGEIPQCFCRLCAVFGGIYCLNKRIHFLNADDDGVTLSIDGHSIGTKNLVCCSGSLPESVDPGNESTSQRQCGNFSRGVFITATPIFNDKLNLNGGGVNVLRLVDPADRTRGAILIELSHHSGTCPKDLYLIHITTESLCNDPEVDLGPFLKQIFNSSRKSSPKILYSAYYQIMQCKICRKSRSKSAKCYSTCGPFYEVDYGSSIQNAKEIFEKIYPNQSFLPRAPDPEEIIIGDEDPASIPKILLDDMESQMYEIEKTVESIDMCADELEGSSQNMQVTQ